MLEFLNANPWALALAIFFARIMDVSLGTVRTILVFRGYSLLSAVIGFFEVMIWILAAGKVLTNLNEWYLILGYAGGFATGNIVGIWLESKLAIGDEIIQVVSENTAIPLAETLRKHGYHVTEIQAKTEEERPVEIIFLVEKRRATPKLLQLVKQIDPEAFFTIENVKKVYGGNRSGKQESTFSDWLSRMKRK